MARFKIGQKVVAIVSDSKPSHFKKGDTLVVKKLSRGFQGDIEMDGIYIIGSNYLYAEKYFAPLPNTSDAIEYKMKVSIPELTEIKETQLQ